MSWIKCLNETYEESKEKVGQQGGEEEPVLLPICHTTQQAQITIALDLEGNFLRATVVPQEDCDTIIPCTEKSGSRAGSKPVNHPLCDKLQYLARDYVKYGGTVTSGYRKNPSEPYQLFIQELEAWCQSAYNHPKVEAVYRYVLCGSMISDLVQNGVLHLNESGHLMEIWDNGSKEEMPEIFCVMKNRSQHESFVRWSVESPGDPQVHLWTDLTMYESWSKYYIFCQSKKGLCYVTGEDAELALSHPSKIRNSGDRAKLISANDKQNFTFRGRFLDGDQATGVSFTVTQQAHNALRWLIQKQGFYTSGLVVLTWATQGEDVPDPLMDFLDFSSSVDQKKNSVSYTGEDFAQNLRRSILGQLKKLENTDGIMVLVLDAATSGRLSIRLYREFDPRDYISKIENWHRTTAWVHTYRNRRWFKSFAESVPTEYVSAPSPIDMVESIYGHRLDEKLRKKAIERLIRCIVDGEMIPQDMVATIVRRAANPVALERWEWSKALTIACSMYRKFKEKEGYSLALEEQRRNRDYLYGRLLALADSLEEWALNQTGEQRQTNAIRLMQRFSERPYSTWRLIELALTPYKARLGWQGRKRANQISEVMELFDADEFTSDKKLSGEFLLGYHCQKRALWAKEEPEDKTTSEE